MEQCVELIKSQLSVDGLFLVPLVQEFHLEEDHAVATVGAHAISGGDGKLVIKVNQLAIVYLLEQILKLLCLRSTLAFVDRSDVVIDVFGVFCDAHFLKCL